MKNILYISVLLFTFAVSRLTSHAQLGINDGTTKIHINGSGSKIDINPYFRQGTTQDNGYYNGFLQMSDVVNKEAWGVYKKGATHGGACALMLTHTNYWGDFWTEDTIKVDGVFALQTINYSFYRYASGRMVLAYREWYADSIIHFAYSDDNTKNFIGVEDSILTPTGYAAGASPIRMQETSYGTLIFAYYKVGTGGNPNSAVLMESLDEGETWDEKSVVYTATDTYPTGFPACRANEIAICETHPTGIEATSKWIAILRPQVGEDGGGYYPFYRSTDGGNTWTIDPTTYAGSFTDDNGATVSSGAFSKSAMYLFLSSNSPVDIKLVGDSVYVVNGNRNATHGFGLVYLSATPDSAFSNRIVSWTRHPYVELYYDGSNPGSSTDFGYPVLFTSGNEIFVSQYIVSSLSPLPGVTRRCKVYTKKIK